RGWNSAAALAGLDDLFASEVPADRVAAIIVEPVLGEGGFVPAPREFLQGLRAVTEKHGIVLIVDEIQTGFGRTGKFFAIEHSGVEPDLMTVAKSLAAGFPLSGVVGKAEIMDAPAPGGLGGTYAGNPVACAAGLAVLDVMRDERLPERAARIGSVAEARTRSATRDWTSWALPFPRWRPPYRSRQRRIQGETYEDRASTPPDVHRRPVGRQHRQRCAGGQEPGPR